MSAAQIRECLTELREAGRHLRRRRAADVLDALAQVLELWRDPHSPPRDALAKQLPDETGFSEPVVREGLSLGHAAWTRDALLGLVESEFGGREGLEAARGFEVNAAVLAGTIPMPSLLAVVTPLVLRSPVLVKSASRDRVTAEIVHRSLAMVDPELADCVAVVAFGRDDAESTAALLSADCVVASGDDDSIARLTAGVAAPRRFVGHGHRVSLAALGPAVSGAADLDGAMDALALDVALWDQEGCLSPISLYVVGDASRARLVGEALAAALERIAPRLPRGRLDPETHARLAQQREAAELRAAAGEPVVVHAGPDYCVVVEPDARPRSAPLGRFLRVHPVADAAGLRAALAPLARHLAAVGHAGFATLPELPGSPRRCALGQLQAPPLSWARDGHSPLLSITQL